MPRRCGLCPQLLAAVIRSKATLAFAAERQVVRQTGRATWQRGSPFRNLRSAAQSTAGPSSDTRATRARATLVFESTFRPRTARGFWFSIFRSKNGTTARCPTIKGRSHPYVNCRVRSSARSTQDGNQLREGDPSCTRSARQRPLIGTGELPNRPLQQTNATDIRSKFNSCRDAAGCARGSSRPWYARRRPWRSLLNGRSLDRGRLGRRVSTEADLGHGVGGSAGDRVIATGWIDWRE